jgi:hypothetical protein
VTLFESAHRDFAEVPLPAAKLARMRAWTISSGLAPLADRVAARVEACAGGGCPAFERRPSTLVVITDGQVGNETEIERALVAHPDLRLHVFLIQFRTTISPAGSPASNAARSSR